LFLKTDGAGNLSFSSDLPTTSFTGATVETSIADSDLVLIYDDSATAVRKMTKANLIAGVGGTNTPAFHVFLSADQTLTNSTLTKVQFNNEEFDTNSAYDNSTNYRFTVPSGQSGKYYFYSNIMFQNLTSSRIAMIAFYKNGSQISEYRDVTAAENDISISAQIALNLIATDFIEVFAYQNDTGTEVAGGNIAASISSFGGFKIID
jgi:hypothetical protein